jgi:hypothetical protein
MSDSFFHNGKVSVEKGQLQGPKFCHRVPVVQVSKEGVDTALQFCPVIWLNSFHCRKDRTQDRFHRLALKVTPLQGAGMGRSHCMVCGLDAG